MMPTPFRFQSMFAIFVVVGALILPSCAAFSVPCQQQQQPRSDTSLNAASSNRRDFLQTASLALASVGLPQSPAFAAEEIVVPTREVVTNTFAPIKFELNDPKGGVSIMQEKIDQKDFAGLLEFTKTYDLELRKLRMGKAKKLIQSKEIKEKATSYANAVTFDLIGINRSCRDGKQDLDSAQKYLQELRDDISKFLELESTIEVQG